MQPENPIITDRVVYADTRSCLNCYRHGTCNTIGNEYAGFMPMLFSLRSRWTQDNFSKYIKEVLGGVCGNFIYEDLTLRARQEANALRAEELKPKDWDK